jgi:hypothetical protein
MKYVIKETRNSINGFKSQLNTSANRISKQEDRAEKIPKKAS